MDWLFLTILAIISRAVYSLASRLLSVNIKVKAPTQVFLITLTLGILSLLVSSIIGGINLSGVEKYIPMLLLITLASVIGNIIYFKSQKQLDAGTTQIAFSTILIWGTILSVLLLKSQFTLKQFLGIALMLIAIITIQYKKSKMTLNNDIVLIIGSAFLFAFFQVASASISKLVSTATYLLLNFLGQAILILPFYFQIIWQDVKNLIKSNKTNTVKSLLFTAGTSLLYNIFSYLAYQIAPNRGIVVVLLTSQVVLSVIFGIIFLKEKDNLVKKLLAGLLAFLAGVLIKS